MERQFTQYVVKKSKYVGKKLQFWHKYNKFMENTYLKYNYKSMNTK